VLRILLDFFQSWYFIQEMRAAKGGIWFASGILSDICKCTYNTWVFVWV